MVKILPFLLAICSLISSSLQVLMATNRPDTLDPALMRPGRLDRKVEFSLPDLDGRTNIFRIHARYSVSFSLSFSKDLCQVDERGEGHPLRAAGEALP